MKILVYGAGVIGTVYAWQLTEAGQDVTLLVRAGKSAAYRNGIPIRCRDERGKKPVSVETIYCANVVESIQPADRYDLIVVCVKSNQLGSILPALAESSGKADILFFCNNWEGDEKIRLVFPKERVFFGFSRIVGGWRNGTAVEGIIFAGPGRSTKLGEIDGRVTPRLKQIETVIQSAGLKPEISSDILGWLKFHYVEYLGATGAILKAGSAKAFAASTDLVRDAILATREALSVCRAQGTPLKSAPFNLRLYRLPLPLLVWIGQKQYQDPNIQTFFEENIHNGLEELTCQYHDVLQEGKRLGVAMPVLSGFAAQFDRAHG